MSEIKFNEKAHRYTLDGKPLTGVTTILGVIAKPALIQWSANMAVDYLIANPGDYKGARKAYAIKRDAAADIGTIAHKWIEDWINGEKPKENPEVSHMTDNFVEWATDNEVEFLASEKIVYSKKHWFAGTLDFLCKIKGKTYLGDIKTSSGIYDEYFFQTSAYQLALQEHEDIKIDGHVIVNCKKDGGFNKKFSFDYDKNIKAFLGALDIYRRKGELERANPWKKKYKKK